MNPASLSAALLRRYSAAVHELYRHTEEGLPVQALVRAVQGLVPHTWTSVDELCAAEGIMVHHGGHNVESLTHVAAAQREFGTGNPNVQHFLKHGVTAGVVKWSDLISQPRLRDTAYYQEVIRDVGVREQAAVVTPLRTGAIGIGIMAERAFGSEETFLLAMLQPHIRLLVTRGLQYQHLGAAQPLTAREREVLHWLAEGKSDGEISLILQVSARTVQQHLRQILAKLGVESRTAAAARAWRARMAGAFPAPAEGLVLTGAN